MKKILLLLLLFTNYNLFSQLPETDIFVCKVTFQQGRYTFSKPKNVTNRKGYDNQPCFSNDGKKLLYIAVEDSTQSDIYEYDFQTKKRTQVTNTKVSEYSPAYTPDNKHLSVVRVDADSGQRFYYLPLNDLNNAQVIKNTDSIGYACSLNDSALAMFILGPANTLQVLNLKTSQRKLIASDIGRCMKLSPDHSKMYFLLKSNPTEWFIYSMDCKDYSLTRVTQTMPESEDFAVLPNGKLIMGKSGKLYIFQNSRWEILADFTEDVSDFYRISINNDATFISLVAYTGKKP